MTSHGHGRFVHAPHSLFFFFSSLASFFSLAVLVGAFLDSFLVSLAFMAVGWLGRNRAMARRYGWTNNNFPVPVQS